MRFTVEEEFYATVNQWVRDGSNITGFYSSSSDFNVVYIANLVGADGVKEELVLVL